MGICTAKNRSPESKAIDDSMKVHKDFLHNQVKMLLLGPGESGKSTLFKQMKIIQDAGGFSNEELMGFKNVVHSNCFGQMKVLIGAATNLQVAFGSKDAMEAAQRLLQIHQQGVTMNAEAAQLITLLWKDKGIQEVYQLRGSRYQLNDTAEYFFNNIERVAKDDYVPTSEDVLRARVRSTGIEEAQFTFEQLTFTVVDVGGQRSERRKWIHCFDNVTVVLFCAALSAYDQTLREDSSQNRMIEAILLFEEVSNSPYFSKRIPIMLFLNKTDLFQEKFARVPLNVCFPDYKGKTMDDAKDFILARFKEKIFSDQKVYTHFTCALNTQNIRIVITTIRKLLLQGDIDEFLL